jgi:hypothetical protein
VLQVSENDLQNYLNQKYAPPSDLKLNMSDVLETLFPKELYDYVTFSSLNYLISTGLAEVRAWQDRLGDLRLYAGNNTEDKHRLTDKLARVRKILEDFEDKLQQSLQNLWNNAQSSPIKIQLEDFANTWQKAQPILNSLSTSPQSLSDPISPEFAQRVQEGLLAKVQNIQNMSNTMEFAYPQLKSLMLDLLAQFQARANAAESQGLWRSMKEIQFIMSLIPQMLQGREYPRQSVEIYNVNTLLDLGKNC